MISRVLNDLVTMLNHEILHDVFPEPVGSPTTELDAPRRSYTIAYGYDGVEIVVVDIAGDLTSAFNSNYPEFPDSCLSLELLFFIDILEMLAYCPDILLVQFSYEGL
jgi:hypothetical protein